MSVGCPLLVADGNASNVRCASVDNQHSMARKILPSLAKSVDHGATPAGDRAVNTTFDLRLGARLPLPDLILALPRLIMPRFIN
jgi:hypothetical protein